MHPDDVTLGDYADDTLPAGPRRDDVDRHLADCAVCRDRVDGLRAIRRAAGALKPVIPPEHVWARIERTLRAESSRALADTQSTSRRSWMWLAAAAAILLAVFVGVRMRPTPAREAAGSSVTTTAPTAIRPDEPPATAASVEAELLQAEAHYQKAITGLEQIANAERGSLDPQTAATLEKNLQVIDQAISESRTALRTEPGSQPAQQSLLDSFKAKLTLLQDTVALINEMRRGDDAGAARAVSGMNQKG